MTSKAKHGFAVVTDPGGAQGGRMLVRVSSVYVKEPAASLLAAKLNKTMIQFFTAQRAKVSGFQGSLWVTTQ